MPWDAVLINGRPRCYSLLLLEDTVNTFHYEVDWSCSWKCLFSKNNLWTLDEISGLWPSLRWTLHLSPGDRASGHVSVAGRYFIFYTSSQVIFSSEFLSSLGPSYLISCCLHFQYCCSGQKRCVIRDVSGLRGTRLRAGNLPGRH